MTARALLLFLALSVTPPVWGQCMRMVPMPPGPPNIDGPGAFGPLHDTLTLDCLHFVGTQRSKTGLVATLVDEKGRTYAVRPGWRVGENDGRVSKIEPDRITIVQLVKNSSNEWVEVLRYLFREVDLSRALGREAAAKIARDAAVAAGRDAGRYQLNEGFVIEPQPDAPAWEFVFDCKFKPAPLDCGFRVSVDAVSGKTKIMLLP